MKKSYESIKTKEDVISIENIRKLMADLALKIKQCWKMLDWRDWTSE